LSIFFLLCYYSYITFQQNNYWKDPESFFITSLKYSDYKARLYNELGIVYYEKGMTQKAIDAFNEGLKTEPQNVSIQNNLRRVLK
jgi:hypothetical protein